MSSEATPSCRQVCAQLPRRPASAPAPPSTRRRPPGSLGSDSSQRGGPGPRAAPVGGQGSGCSRLLHGTPGRGRRLAEAGRRRVCHTLLPSKVVRPRAVAMTDGWEPQISVTSGVRRGSRTPHAQELRRGSFEGLGPLHAPHCHSVPKTRFPQTPHLRFPRLQLSPSKHTLCDQDVQLSRAGAWPPGALGRSRHHMAQISFARSLRFIGL